MQVRVFEAPDMTSGLKMVKEALGPDALILSSRTVRKGKLGLLGKASLEITAAVDNRWAQDVPEDPQRPSPELIPPQSPPRRPDWASLTYARVHQATGRDEDVPPSPPAPPRRQENDPLQQELKELRLLIRDLASRMEPASQPIVGHEAQESLQPHGTPGQQPASPIMELLQAMGVDRQNAATINRFAETELSPEQMHDPQVLHQFLAQSLAGIFRTTDHLSRRKGRQQRLALVGATGVGKTTTIAKLAARSMAGLSGNIALITIDTYRIAAVEQLRIYSEIMKIPLEVVLQPQDLEQALERHRHCDLILIDTAGRSPRNERALQDLADFFPPHLGIETHLVLSAPTRETELEDSITRFARLPLASFIFTKLDECGSLGVLLNTQLRHGLPISYLANGQRVPEDIQPADPVQLADMILSHDGACYHG